ncbi:MAG TPA: S8 family peptidase [Pseudonocardiaceae bacterium]
MIPRPSRRTVIVVALATLGAGLLSVTPAASHTHDHAVAGVGAPAATPGQILYAGTREAVPNGYIVSLGADTAPSDVDRIADSLLETYGGVKQFSYGDTLPGFSMNADATTAARMAGDPRVEYVAQDQYYTTDALVVQPTPGTQLWGLDRIDERSLPRDNKYHYPNTASNVTAFVIDTGMLLNHQEFAPAGRAVCGFDPFLGGCAPCGLNHGTHVAGTIGGVTTGVAKGVQLVSVRVFNCTGSTTAAIVIAGVNFVTLSAQINPSRRMVANMSLGGPSYAPMNTAVNNSIVLGNVHYSVAAGNNGQPACNYSPASTPNATTVGATTINDVKPIWSNYGTCVDLFAPGETIYSASIPATNSYATLSGTSMASPHAAGTAALWRHKFPADNALAVAAALNGNATPGVLSSIGVGSPNRLLFMAMVPV